MNLIQNFMNVLDGISGNFIRKFFHEQFQLHQLMCIDPSCWIGNGLCVSIRPFNASVRDGKQSNVCGAGNAKTASNFIHRVANPPCSCSDRKHHQPDSSDQGRLFLERCFRCRNAAVILHNRFPMNGHVLLFEFCHVKHRSFRLIIYISFCKNRLTEYSSVSRIFSFYGFCSGGCSGESESVDSDSEAAG